MDDELLLDVPSDADELPTDVDAALDADDVLSASAGAAARQRDSTEARACVWCMRNIVATLVVEGKARKHSVPGRGLMVAGGLGTGARNP